MCFQAKLKEMGQSLEISSAVFFGMEGMPNLLNNPYNPKKSLNLYTEILKSCFGLSKLAFSTLALYFLRDVNCFIPKSKFQHYMDKNEALSKKLSLLLGDDSVLLYPTHPTPAGFHHEMYVKTSGVLYAMAMNTLGLPATQVPVGLNEQGLPLGFQVSICHGVSHKSGPHPLQYKLWKRTQRIYVGIHVICALVEKADSSMTPNGKLLCPKMRYVGEIFVNDF